MLSDAAFASALTSSYRANLLLPQLKPPVKDTARANRDAASRADAKQQQNADQRKADARNAAARQSAASAARAAEGRRLTRASQAQAAARANELRAAADTNRAAIQTADRVTLNSVSEIAQRTLAGQRLHAGDETEKAKQRFAEANQAGLYRLRDVKKSSAGSQQAVAAEINKSAAVLTRAQVSAAPVSVQPASAAQRYQQLNAATSPVATSGNHASSGGKPAATGGVSLRA